MNNFNNKEYVYFKRSCANCTRFPCFPDQQRTESDFAKYGCQNYAGKYLKEKKLSEINKQKVNKLATRITP